MSKKNMGGLVYSTAPNFCPNSPTDDIIETLPPEKQRLRLRYERSGRGGKEVTLVTGFVGSSEDLKALATKLKQAAGCGGSAKDGEIILQGDKRSLLVPLLQRMGYKDTK